MAFSCICPPFSAYLYKAEGLCLHKLVVKLFTWGNRRLTCINHLFPLPRMSDIRESKHWQDIPSRLSPQQKNFKTWGPFQKRDSKPSAPLPTLPPEGIHPLHPSNSTQVTLFSSQPLSFLNPPIDRNMHTHSFSSDLWSCEYAWFF